MKAYQAQERRLEQKIETMLAKIVGREQVVARVSVNLAPNLPLCLMKSLILMVKFLELALQTKMRPPRLRPNLKTTQQVWVLMFQM